MSEIEWMNLRAPQLRELASEGAVVVVPVGSMEQHGPHLPVQVDALLATEVSRRAALRIREHQPVVLAPTVWSGLAEHHMGFGGTITLDFDTFRAVLRCVCESASRHGFRRIVLMNGHGGNVSALGVIAGELERAVDARVAVATYWHMPGVASAFAGILEKQDNVLHAGEAESSMLLALRPALVDEAAMHALPGGLANIVDESGLFRYRSFAELTDSGVIGFPAAATTEKGEALLEAAGAAIARAIVEGSIWR